jgi:hypothetical protein
MAGKYDNAFPNAQKVQIFEQVDTYIENNNPVDPEIKATIADLQTLITHLQTQHPNITTETQAIDIIDVEFTEIKRDPSHKLATLRKQILNPERHAQAFKAALVEGAKKKLDNSLLATVAITYIDKLSETPDQGA